MRQMRALQMFGTFMPVLFKIWVWKCHLDTWLCTLHKDHFDISYVRFGGGHVVPDEGFGDVWEIYASVDHDRGLEMSC